MTERYSYITEDQARADQFVKNELLVPLALNQIDFYTQRWETVQDLAARPGVANIEAVTELDTKWLQKLGATVDETFSYDRTTALVRAGSHIIAEAGELTMPPNEASAVAYARSAFLGKVLGWETLGAAPQYIKRYHAARSESRPAYVPLRNFVTAQRLLHGADISVSGFAYQRSDILDVDPTKVQNAINSGLVQGSTSGLRVNSFIKAYATQ